MFGKFSLLATHFSICYSFLNMLLIRTHIGIKMNKADLLMMIKNNANLTKEEKKEDIRVCTWDLFICLFYNSYVCL